MPGAAAAELTWMTLMFHFLCKKGYRYEMIIQEKTAGGGEAVRNKEQSLGRIRRG